MAIDSKNKLVAIKSFARGNPLPLDSSEVYDSYDEALEYANSPTAYAGQTIKVLVDGKYRPHIIQPDSEHLLENVIGDLEESLQSTAESTNANTTAIGNLTESTNTNTTAIGNLSEWLQTTSEVTGTNAIAIANLEEGSYTHVVHKAYGQNVEREEGKLYLVEQTASTEETSMPAVIGYLRVTSDKNVQGYSYRTETFSHNMDYDNIQVEHYTREVSAVSVKLPCDKGRVKNIVLKMPFLRSLSSAFKNLNVFPGCDITDGSASFLEAALPALNCSYSSGDNEYDSSKIIKTIGLDANATDGIWYYTVDLTDYLDQIVSDSGRANIILASAGEKDSVGWTRLYSDISKYSVAITYDKTTGYALETADATQVGLFVSAALKTKLEGLEDMYVQSTAPSSPSVNNLWIYDDFIRRYDGTNWIDVVPEIPDTSLKLTIYGDAIPEYEYWVEHEDNVYKIKLNYTFDSEDYNMSSNGLDIYIVNIDTTKPLQIQADLKHTVTSDTGMGMYIETTDHVEPLSVDDSASPNKLSGTWSIDTSQYDLIGAYFRFQNADYLPDGATEYVYPDFRGYIKIWQ